MMKKYFTALLLTTALGAGAAQAATLTELNGPLLNKNQWELNALTGIDYEKSSSRTTNVGSAGFKTIYDYTQVSLSPDVTYGLTDKMSLMVKEAYIVPYSFYYEDVMLPGGAYAYRENTLLVRNTLTSALTWRPSEPWEFYFDGSRGYANTYSRNGDLPEGSGNTATQGMHGYSTVLSAQATWLSNPKAGALTANNRADLDGLLNPLLDRGQIKTDLSLSYYDNYSHTHQNSISGTQSFTSNRRYYQQLSASSCFLYGIRDNLQVQASASVIIPNASYNSSRDHTVQNLTTFKYSMSKGITLAGTSPGVRITHRIDPRLQWYATGSYNYQKASNRRLAVSGATSRSVTGHESASIGFGADWVSRPQKDGRPLAADLDGLKRPLLEKGQYRVGASYTTGKQREWTNGGTSEAGRNTNRYYSEFAYGLRDTLQGFASLDITPGYSTWSGTTYESINFPIANYTAGLTWRPRQTFQLNASASITPYYEKDRSYDGSGNVQSVTKNRNLDTSTTLSATWLW